MDFSSEEAEGNRTTSSVDNCSLFQNEYCESPEDYEDRLLAYIYPDHYEWTLIAAHLVVFIVGLVGNALVCVSVFRNTSMRTVTNYFIVNLAVADFLVILVCLPPTVIWDVTATWFLGDALCKIVLYFQVKKQKDFKVTFKYFHQNMKHNICQYYISSLTLSKLNIDFQIRPTSVSTSLISLFQEARRIMEYLKKNFSKIMNNRQHMNSKITQTMNRRTKDKKENYANFCLKNAMNNTLGIKCKFAFSGWKTIPWPCGA